MRDSLVSQLGYLTGRDFRVDTETLISKYKNGVSAEELLSTDVLLAKEDKESFRVFENVDGVKFLNHEGGCGGTMDDIQNLCNLIAGYITHPNTGGATVLSLGCQMAQIKMLKEAILKLDPDFNKPLEIFEQQQAVSERQMIADAVKRTLCRPHKRSIRSRGNRHLSPHSR